MAAERRCQGFSPVAIAIFLRAQRIWPFSMVLRCQNNSSWAFFGRNVRLHNICLKCSSRYITRGLWTCSIIKCVTWLHHWRGKIRKPVSSAPCERLHMGPNNLCCVTRHSLFIFSLCRDVTFYKSLTLLSTFFIKAHVGLLQLLKWPCRTSFFTHVEPYVIRPYHNSRIRSISS